MPELPEVETITRQLHRQVLGKMIMQARVLVKRIADSQINDLHSRKIVDITRRAKVIIVELDGKLFLLFRLGMTGHFHYVKETQRKRGEGRGAEGTKGDKKAGQRVGNRAGKKSKNPEEEYLIAQFLFQDGSLLTFNDIRKFGSIRVLSEQELHTFLDTLGPEPLATEFTLDAFVKLLAKKAKAKVKVTLMDQGFISGIGNIYAQEALYHGGIHPQRRIGSLSMGEIARLYHSLRSILTVAIEKHGTTVDTYAHMDGKGDFQNYLAVYQREKCPKKHAIVKIYLGGRGTFYCPQCQK